MVHWGISNRQLKFECHSLSLKRVTEPKTLCYVNTALKRFFYGFIEPKKTKTGQWPCLHNKELWALYLAYNSMHDFKILHDH